MPALRSPEDILATELKEIYGAERQLSRAIPRLAKKVHSERLRDLLEQRREQGEALIEELDEALNEMDVTKGRPKNIAAEGLIEDANQHLEEIEDEALRDTLLLASVQKIEHYCIAAWGTAKSMGRLLGQDKVVETMEHVLDEGKRYDEELTQLAEKEINPKLMQGEDEDAEETEEDAEGENDGSARGGKKASGRRSKSH